MPGTERHDCDDVDERGVVPGTTSSGIHEDGSPSAACLTRPASETPLCPLNSSDMTITGERVLVPHRRSVAIGVATAVGRLVVHAARSVAAAEWLSLASVSIGYLDTHRRQCTLHAGVYRITCITTARSH